MVRTRPAAPSTEVVTVAETSAGSALDMRSLIAAAAAIKLDSGAVMRRQIGDQEWQREGWRHYDLNGELRFAANRHAAALSQCRIYVAEVDKLGKPGKEVSDAKVQGLSETIFGGPAAKAEYLRTIDLQLYVSGETYIVAEGATNPKSDVWYVVSPGQIRKNGSKYKVKRPEEYGGGTRELVKGQDLLMRTWTPHPRDFDVADSPVRAVLPILREIERLTLLTFSQIDSRLISAGLLLLPQDTSFPDQDGKSAGLRGLLEMILEVATAQLTGAGTAAGLVPILGEIPAGTGGDIQHLKFETALTNEIKEKLEHAIQRLAIGLDIAPEELLGQGSANHWSAWSIDETGIKLFIQPVMTRICDALTRGYLWPALVSMGVKDVEQYTLWFDASPLTVRPNRFEDAVILYDKHELSAEEMRKAGNFPDDATPTKKELTALRAFELVKLDPTLLQQKAYADLLGLPVSEPPAPPQPELPPGVDPGDPAVRDSVINQQLGLPTTESGGKSPAQSSGFASMLPGAEQVVLRALERAGSRLLDRHQRGRYPDVDAFALHTRILARDPLHARELLTGAFAHVPALAAHHNVSPEDLAFLLTEYCSELLVRGYPHSPELLATMLDAAATRG